MIKWIKKITGFTLLELLVVIAIIAILSSILLPVLSNAKKKGRQTVCISNLKEIFLAMEMYKNDNGGYYPISYIRGSSSYPRTYWSGSRSTSETDLDFTGSPIYPYLKAGEIKTCPSFKQFGKGSNPKNGGYGYNEQFIGGMIVGDTVYYKQHKDSEIKNPSDTVILSDTAGIKGGEIVEQTALIAPYYKVIGGGEWAYTVPRIHFRHNGLANVCWADGHVTSERMSYSWRSKYDRDYPENHIGYIGEFVTDAATASDAEAAIANALYGHHEP